MQFCCASNGPIKICENRKKKLSFFYYIFNEIVIFLKSTKFLGKKNIYFWILEVLPVI